MAVRFDTVREIALSLPDVEEGATFDAPAFKIHGRLLACEALNKSAEPNSLMVRIDDALRAELLRSDPDVYYLTPHYEPWSSVLVRLEKVSRAELRKLLGTACVFMTSKYGKKRGAAKKKGRTARTTRKTATKRTQKTRAARSRAPAPRA